MLIILTGLQGEKEPKRGEKTHNEQVVNACSPQKKHTKDETAPLILLTPKNAEVLGTCRRAQKASTQRKRGARMVVADGDAVQTGAYIREDSNLSNTQPGGGSHLRFLFGNKYTPVKTDNYNHFTQGISC